MGNLTGQDKLLLEQIVAALKAKASYMQFFDEDDTAGITKVRALGRRAGRELQWKVRTAASDPDRREDRRIGVLVWVEESSPLHQELMNIRQDKHTRKVIADELRSPRP